MAHRCPPGSLTVRSSNSWQTIRPYLTTSCQERVVAWWVTMNSDRGILTQNRNCKDVWRTKHRDAHLAGNETQLLGRALVGAYSRSRMWAPRRRGPLWFETPAQGWMAVLGPLCTEHGLSGSSSTPCLVTARHSHHWKPPISFVTRLGALSPSLTQDGPQTHPQPPPHIHTTR